MDQKDYILVFRMFDVLILGISVAEPSGFLWCVRTHARRCACVRTHLADPSEIYNHQLRSYLQTVGVPARGTLQVFVSTSIFSIDQGKWVKALSEVKNLEQESLWITIGRHAAPIHNTNSSKRLAIMAGFQVHSTPWAGTPIKRYIYSLYSYLLWRFRSSD